MATPYAWLGIAQDGELAAKESLSTHPRSSISRYYYAAYSASHALLLHLGVDPPPRGNWDHAILPECLRSSLMARMGSIPSRNATIYKKGLQDLYNQRIAADYGPLRTVDEQAANDARKWAGQLVRLAEKVLES